MDFDFATGLAELVERVDRDPARELICFQPGEPLSEEAIDSAGARFGRPLPEELRRFYAAVNGVTLRWCYTVNLDARRRQWIAEWDSARDPEGDLFDGSIRIPSLEDLLFHEDHHVATLVGVDDWSGTDFEPEEFAGITATVQQIYHQLYFFDVIDEFYGMCLFAWPGHDAWRVLLVEDYGADYQESRLLGFGDYLRYVIATDGLASRIDLFKEYRGDRREPLGFDPVAATEIVRTADTRHCGHPD